MSVSVLPLLPVKQHAQSVEEWIQESWWCSVRCKLQDFIRRHCRQSRQRGLVDRLHLQHIVHNNVSFCRTNITLWYLSQFLLDQVRQLLYIGCLKFNSFFCNFAASVGLHIPIEIHNKSGIVSLHYITTATAPPLLGRRDHLHLALDLTFSCL